MTVRSHLHLVVLAMWCQTEPELKGMLEELQHQTVDGIPCAAQPLLKDLMNEIQHNSSQGFDEKVQHASKILDGQARASVLNTSAINVDAEEDPELRQLKQCAEEGVESRSKFGLRFSRSASGQSADYHACKTNAAKQAFRKAWAKNEFDLVYEQRSQSRSFAKADISWGRYLGFERIVVEEGGGPNSLQRATVYVSKCVLLGGSWCKQDSMTDSIKYLYVEMQYQEKFERSWSLLVSHSRDSVAVKSPKASQAEAALAVTQTPAKRTLPEGHQPVQGTPVKVSKIPREKSAVEKTMASVMKVKVEYQSVMTSSSNLAEQLQIDDAWAWALSPATRQGFDNALAAITKERSAFISDLLTAKPQDFRKKFSDDDFVFQGTLFTQTVPPLLKELKLQADMLLSMHQQRLKFLCAEPVQAKPALKASKKRA